MSISHLCLLSKRSRLDRSYFSMYPQSVSLSQSQPVSQSVSQSVNQSINQLNNHPSTDPSILINPILNFTHQINKSQDNFAFVFLDLYLADHTSFLFVVSLIYFISFMSALGIHSLFTVIHRKHFVTMISLRLVIIIVKYWHSYFVRFVNAVLPYVLRWGCSLPRGTPLFCAVRRWRGRHVNTVWLVWNIWWES